MGVREGLMLVLVFMILCFQELLVYCTYELGGRES